MDFTRKDRRQSLHKLFIQKIQLALYFLLIACFFSANKVCALTLPTGFSQVQVASGITNPTVMAFAPDGRIFVAQQSGALRVIKNGVLLTTPFITLSVASTGERGLLGIAFDPAFNTNQYIYLYYTLSSAANNRISRFTANGDVVVPGSEVVVLNLDPLSTATNHNGGSIEFGPDGKLYVGVGNNANNANSQNLDTYHGKILRINPDGTAPAGNPYTTGTAQRQRVWENGLRNPYTITFQPGTGKLFVDEVGENTWEEINDCTVGGLNYGWSLVEGMGSNPLYTNPIYVYGHGTGAGLGCAITGGTFFNPPSTTFPATYIGRYFYLEYCGKWIDMLNLSGPTITNSNFASALQGSPVSLTTGPDGNLYYLSRTSSALYKITYTLAPTATISGTTTVCQNSGTPNITFTGAIGSPPFTFTYTINGGSNQTITTISGSSVSLPVSSSSPGTYTYALVKVSDNVASSQDQSGSATITVTANVAPAVSIGASATSICSGTSVTFTPTPTNGGASPAYQWKVNGTNASVGGSYVTSGLSNSDAVSCVMTSNLTCVSPATANSNSIPMTVTATVTPAITISTGSTTICDQSNATFSSSISSGGTTPGYLWKKNGTSTGITANSYSNSSLINGDMITCVLTSNATCASPTSIGSNTLTMTVNPSVTPTLSITTNSSTICTGTLTTFYSVQTNGGTTPVYAWKKNGTTVGTNATSYSDNGIINGDVIQCVMSSNAVCTTAPTANSNSIPMTVAPPVTPGVSISTNTTSICSGTIANFSSVQTNGGSNPTYQWKKNGTNVGINSNSYADNTLINGDAISCVLTSNATCANPASVTSNIIPISTVTNCAVNMNITFFLEGFFRPGNTMVPTLYNMGLNADPTACDTVELNLWNTIHLVNSAPDFSGKGILHTNGTSTIVTGAVPGSYYLALKTRNSIETWSKNPVAVSGSSTNYIFSNNLLQAYDAGVNPPMKLMNVSLYALYGGDINRDGTVDIMDMQVLENDVTAFAFGYQRSDVNGDGSSDIADMAIVENNTNLFLYYARPY